MNDLTRLLLVVFGIGLVIFVHELGHFLAARWCKVRVHVFSLGFGPRLLAWQRGDTLYQLALLPLGGYVRMAGEDPEPGAAPPPDSLPAKSVGARFLIYSGGVLMNMVFALVVFPIVLAVGVPMNEPIVGGTQPGSPAWHAGLSEGTRIHEVNGQDVQDFLAIRTAIALGSHEATELVVERPGSTQRETLTLKPQFSEAMGLYTIGVHASIDRERRLEITPDSPAAQAGLRSGDRWIATEGAPAGLDRDEAFAWLLWHAQPLALRYERDGQEALALIKPRTTPATGERILGVLACSALIQDLRRSPLVESLGLAVGDQIESVGSKPIWREFDLLLALGEAREGLEIVVQRAGQRLSLRGPGLSIEQARALREDIALAPVLDSNRVVVRPGSAAAQAGMQDGDRIIAIDGRPVTRFADVRERVGAANGSAVRLLIQREGADGPREEEFTVEPRAYTLDYGLNVRSAMYTYQAASFSEAVQVGFASSLRFLGDSFLTLVRMFQGNVSSDNLGGIITIGVVSHSWAGMGLAKLFFFLCMLSVNLAFLNVLPIPVLDGGHLAFLLIEKLKGSPVSERVQSASQVVGMVLVGLLILYVTFNDIQRLIQN